MGNSGPRNRNVRLKTPESAVLIRLLYSVFFSCKNGSNEDPSYINIRQILVRAYTATYAGGRKFGITQDNIKTYLRGSVPNESMWKSNVQTHPRRDVLEAINLSLFGTNDACYVQSLSSSFRDVAISDEVRRKVEQFLLDQSSSNLNIGRVLVVPDYDEVNPAEIDALVKHATNNSALKAHFLYHSPVAACKWDLVKESPSYKPLYKLCEEGLKAILDEKKKLLNRLREVEVVFNLGAGSSSKDELILKSLIAAKSPFATFAWIDASFPMIFRTIKGIDPELLQEVHAVALLTDFEKPGRVGRTFESYLHKLRQPIQDFKKIKKAFFILGYTLSNLEEETFFNEYGKVCSVGDVFVFPMQFIPEDCKDDPSKLATFNSQLKGNYNFKEGRELAQAGLALLQEYEPTTTRIVPEVGEFIFDGNKHSQCVRFFVELKEKGSAYTKSVVTARSIRHYEKDYMAFLRAKGFALLDKSEERDGVQTVAIEFVGRQ